MSTSRILSGPVTPRTYRVAVAVAGAAMSGIVLTGAGVRLSQSGLGCSDWPTCSGDQLVPAWGLHPWVEFGNRLLTFAVSAPVAGAVLAAHRRRPRRRDLIVWAWGLVAGVVGQIVVGGVSVLLELQPLSVASHFLLSMVLLWNSVVLWVRANSGPAPARPVFPSSIRNHSRAMVVAATAVLVTGTVVTGAGPHSGDSRAERLQIALVTAARIHSATVWLLVAVTVALALRLSRLGPDPRRTIGAGPRRLVTFLMAAIAAQGAVGYTQYALGVPAALVEVHVFGSVVVWCLALAAHLALPERDPMETTEPLAGAENNSARAVIAGSTLDTMKA